MTQHLRSSQFITTYGPGAILEGQGGPKVIPSLEQSGIFNQNRQITDFEITDRNLSDVLLQGAGVVRLPSNAEIGEPDQRWIYNTKRFPTWSLCLRHRPAGILYQKRPGNNFACPKCSPFAGESEAWEQANRQAIRFVRACPDGHLDDVNWIGIIQHATLGCKPDHLKWIGGGGALKNIEIECPVCGKGINLGRAYSTNWPCSGRLPEREQPSGVGSIQIHSPCSKDSRIMQRGAANLRIAEIQSALTIPPRDTPLHRLLEMAMVRAILSTNRIVSKSQLLSLLQNLVTVNLLKQTIIDEITTYDEDTILNAINDTMAGSVPANIYVLRREEFRALKNAASNGHPPVVSPLPGGQTQFEIIQSQVRTIAGPGGHILRITPVNRLRVVMVQTGYRRVPGGDPLNSSVVDCRFHYDGREWYPGVELFGEGVFIDLNTDHHPSNQLSFTGVSANNWMTAWLNPQNYLRPNLPDEERNQLHPAFVWWHTLAHRMINALAIDSGYSSAAVRERVFIDIDHQTGLFDGGILLYTVQPGGDGTLGGMIALVPGFERVLSGALRNLDACSNDPLCGEEQFGPGKYNGAACYACSLVSETSCEYRNMRLDRNVLLQNMP
jgi:hypothetical protein